MCEILEKGGVADFLKKVTVGEKIVMGGVKILDFLVTSLMYGP